MNEIITAGGVKYTSKNVTTGIDTISFTLVSPMEDPESAFREVTELTVGDEQETVYGQYPDVEYESITISADGSVTVSMHILTKTEKQIKELQVSQTEQDKAIAEQDEAIAEIFFGGMFSFSFSQSFRARG